MHLAELMARAFFDDPLFVFIEPDDERRKKALPRLMERMLRAAKQRGVVDVVGTSATPEGVALWFPPRVEPFNLIGILRSGMIASPLPLPIGMGVGATRRLLAAENDLGFQSEIAEAWYLLILAVDPDSQGKGMARTLLDRGSERSGGAPIWLETNNPKNVGMYQHFGFEIIDELDTPGLLRQWQLTRPGTTAS